MAAVLKEVAEKSEGVVDNMIAAVEEVAADTYFVAEGGNFAMTWMNATLKVEDAVMVLLGCMRKVVALEGVAP